MLLYDMRSKNIENIMESTPKFILEIRQRLSELSGNNRKIAEYIINYPELVIQKKVSEFARECHCDSAQVVRLCQKFGYDGFTGLKKRIAADLIDPKHTLHRQLEGVNTPFEERKNNFGQSIARTVNDTLTSLDEESINRAIAQIQQARQIVVCGFGSSALAARDLQTKLVRIGFYAMFFDDAENIKMTCATLTEHDLLILISFSGNTQYILDNIVIAKKKHVPLLALTNYMNSPLAQSAECVLKTTADEQKIRLGAMDSTISQFLVIDLLSSMLAARISEQTEKRILQIFETVTQPSHRKRKS